MKTVDRKEILSRLLEFKRENAAAYHILRLGVFGSVARNETAESGDIDIVVELEKPKMFDLVGIKQDLETLFHRSVDVVRMRKNMNGFLKNRIEKEAIFV